MKREISDPGKLMSALSIAAVLAFAVIFGMSRLETTGLLASQMVQAYLGVLVFFLTLFLFAFVFRRSYRQEEPAARLPSQKSERLAWGAFLFFATAGVIIGFWRFLCEPELTWGYEVATMAVYRTQPLVVFVAAIAIACTGAIALQTSTGVEEPGRWKEIPLWLFYVVLFVAYGYVMYRPDPSVSDSYNMTAYGQSIYNIFFNEPYTIMSTGIYGHYAIFFWLPLKIFGCTSKKVAVLIMLVGFVYLACGIYSIHKLTRNRALRFLGVLLLPSATLISKINPYWQLHPHRLVFVTIMFAYVVWCHQKKDPLSPAKQIGGYIICGLHTLWCTETGVAMSVAYAAYVVLSTWSRQKCHINGKVLRCFLWQAAGVLWAVAFMVVAVNLYNLLVGGPLVFRSCFFPLIGGDGYLKMLAMPLVFNNISWVHVLALFMICFSVAFFDMLRRKAEVSVPSACFVFLSLSGITNMCYYFNRTAYWNLEIVLPQATLCMVLLAQAGFQRLRNKRSPIWYRGMAGGCAFSVLFAFALQTVTCFLDAPVTLQNTLARDMTSTAGLRARTHLLPDLIPEDTYAVGLGMAELYTAMGWDPQYHLRDVSDLFGEGSEDVKKEILAQPTLFVDEFVLSVLGEPPEFVVKQSVYGLHYMEKTGGE